MRGMNPDVALKRFNMGRGARELRGVTNIDAPVRAEVIDAGH